jgi:hypothetical protein
LRRFQDLAMLRQIGGWLAVGRPPYDAAALRRITASTEQAEADARRAERAADDYWRLRWLESRVGEDLEALVLETAPRPMIQLVDTLRDHPFPGLADVEPGQIVRVRVERVNPRAGRLVLRRVD